MGLLPGTDRFLLAVPFVVTSGISCHNVKKINGGPAGWEFAADLAQNNDIKSKTVS